MGLLRLHGFEVLEATRFRIKEVVGWRGGLSLDVL